MRRKKAEKDPQELQDERRALYYLKKIPMFTDLSASELAALSPLVQLHEVRRRRVIFLPGDPGGTVFFVNAGRIKISRVTRDGKELTLFYLGPGEIFGELCMVDGGPREDMAMAMENALVMEMAREEFEKLLDAHVYIGAMMSRVMCVRRKELENKMQDLVFKDVHAKLAELLLELGQDYGVDEDSGTLLAVKVTHQEMANLIGSTRETVSLTLAQFKRKKLITSRGRKIILLDQEGLRALL